MFARADKIDVAEGLLSYQRYHQVMHEIAMYYSASLTSTVAIFCALSPNNDYIGNLRSLVSVLDARSKGWGIEMVQVSTYRHCLQRAWAYGDGIDFLSDAKGLKIRSFYMNVLRPDDNQYVTVDGHVCAAWQARRLVMKEALVKGAKEYHRIADAIKKLAFEEFMLPNQYQAIIWFTRKRVFQIKAEMHKDLFLPPDDVWRTYRDVSSIKPFPERKAGVSGRQKSLWDIQAELFK
jgi:hypothetical protein